MRRFVRFQASLTGQPQAPTDEALAERFSLLREKYPEINEVTLDEPRTEAVKGTIYFEDGVLPDLNELRLAGEESFDGNFQTLEVVYAVAGNRTLDVMCRACQTKIGEVPGYLEAVAAGPPGEADINQRIDEIRSAHFRQAHLGMEPGTL
jgi:hypothetical protein